MKKFASILCLSLMFSLQVFQLCDESHDACEALSHKIQAISQKNFRYTAPKPIDDPDADLPLILEQTLNHGRITCKIVLAAHPMASILKATGTSFISEIPAPDHAPPGAYLADAAPPQTLMLLARSSARILAPPLS